MGERETAYASRIEAPGRIDVWFGDTATYRAEVGIEDPTKTFVVTALGKGSSNIVISEVVLLDPRPGVHEVAARLHLEGAEGARIEMLVNPRVVHADNLNIKTDVVLQEWSAQRIWYAYRRGLIAGCLKMWIKLPEANL